jgi:hypothetical protein
MSVQVVALVATSEDGKGSIVVGVADLVSRFSAVDLVPRPPRRWGGGGGKRHAQAGGPAQGDAAEISRPRSAQANRPVAALTGSPRSAVSFTISPAIPPRRPYSRGQGFIVTLILVNMLRHPESVPVSTGFPFWFAIIDCVLRFTSNILRLYVAVEHEP